MKRENKILLGVLSFIPLLASTFLFIAVFRFFYQSFFQNILLEEPNSQILNSMFAHYIWITLAGLLISLLGLVMMVTFIILAIKDVSASENEKVLWVLILLFLNVISLPLFWYFRLWQNGEFSFEQNLTERSN